MSNINERGITIEPKAGSRRPGWRLLDLDFADDITIIESTLSELEISTNMVREWASGTGLVINKSKTNTMKLKQAKISSSNNKIKIENQEIETSNRFTYLGSIISDKGDLEPELNQRISKASNVFRSQAKIWSNKGLSTKTKMKIYNSIVVSVLLYGAETWNLSETQSKRLDALGMKFQRRIMGIKWTSHTTNEEVLKQTEQTQISRMIRKRRLEWYGHVKRMNKQRFPYRILNWNPSGTRSRGKQKQRWQDLIRKDAYEAGFIDMETFDKVALDRAKWRKLVAAQ